MCSLKWKVDELDIDKLKSVPIGHKKLNDLETKNVVKKQTMVNWFKKLTLLIQTNKTFKKRLRKMIKEYLILLTLLRPKTWILIRRLTRIKF